MEKLMLAIISLLIMNHSSYLVKKFVLTKYTPYAVKLICMG